MSSSHTAPFRSVHMAKTGSSTDQVARSEFLDSIAKRRLVVGRSGGSPAVDPDVHQNTDKEPSRPSENASHFPQSREESCSTSSSSSSWAWNIVTVPYAPSGVPLERTAMELPVTLSLVTISSRICAFMKLNSICCVYHGIDAGVDCSTCCGLKFAVQLWKKEIEKDEDSARFVLEVQRRRGCCLMVRAVRKLLYNAVVKNDLVSVKDVVMNCYKQGKMKKCWAQIFGGSAGRCSIGSEVTLVASEETKPRCLDLLASEKKDCKVFGMDTLLVLVDPEKAGEGIAEEIAQALAFGSGELGSCLRSALLSMLTRADLEKDAPIESELCNISSLESFASDGLDCEQQRLGLLCVMLLSACLDIISERERDLLCNEATTMLDVNSSFWNQTISSLMAHLDACERRQHEAALAAKCLRILETLQPGLLLSLTDSGIVRRAVKAYKVGQEHHMLLEKESELLLETLKLMKN